MTSDKMTFPIDRKAFKAMVDLVKRASDKRITYPILGNIELRADGKALHATCCDLDMELTASIPLESSPFVIAMAAADLADGLRFVEAKTLHLTLTDSRLELAEGADERGYVVPLISDANGARSIVELKTIEEPTHFLRFPRSEFMDAIGRVAQTISDEETRYYLNGVFFNGADDGIELVSTDGHTMTRQRMKWRIGAPLAKIVPKGAIHLLMKMCLRTPADVVDVTFRSSTASFKIGDRVLHTKLIDGTFPDYKRVIPANNPVRITVDPLPLHKELSRLKASVKAETVTLSKDEDGLGLRCINSRKELQDTGVVPAEVDMDFIIHFGVDYLLDHLGIATGGEGPFTIAADGPGGAAVLGGGPEGWTGVLMARA